MFLHEVLSSRFTLGSLGTIQRMQLIRPLGYSSVLRLASNIRHSHSSSLSPPLPSGACRAAASQAPLVSHADPATRPSQPPLDFHQYTSSVLPPDELSVSPFSRPGRKLLEGSQIQDNDNEPGLVDIEFSLFPQNMSTREAAQSTGSGVGLLAFFADHQPVPLPPGHRFPMNKYRRMRASLLLDESLDEIMAIHPSPLISREELLRVHCPEYVKKVEEGRLTPLEERTIGFPWSIHSVNRARASSGGTVAATHAVLLGLWRAAACMAGGTHHAFRDRGEGFCFFNDIAVAAAMALEEYPHICNKDRPILVVDLDVHQGNGTAAIFQGSEEVITFSAHGAKNYPWRSKMRSTYDMDLEDEMQDAQYLDMLSQWLPFLFQKHKPGLVFYQAGVDGLKEDSFGRLSLSREGLLRRNHMVYSQCIQNNVPMVITMGGGYSKPLQASIQAHADVYRSAAYRFGAQGNSK